jgi:hypothetical protein
VLLSEARRVRKVARRRARRFRLHRCVAGDQMADQPGAQGSSTCLLSRARRFRPAPRRSPGAAPNPYLQFPWSWELHDGWDLSGMFTRVLPPLGPTNVITSSLSRKW